jgi:hypothetical protein
LPHEASTNDITVTKINNTLFILFNIFVLQTTKLQTFLYKKAYTNKHTTDHYSGITTFFALTPLKRELKAVTLQNYYYS